MGIINELSFEYLYKPFKLIGGDFLKNCFCKNFRGKAVEVY